MAEPPYRDDPSISDDTDLWRRIHPNWVVWDNNDKMLRVTSAAFSDSADKSPLSVLIADVVRATDRKEHDLLVSFEGYSLVAITAGHARENKQGVARTPTPDEPAHASVFGPKTKRIKRQLALGASWVIPPG